MIIQQLLTKNISFAVYRLPEESSPYFVVNTCPPRRFSIGKLETRKGFVIAPFDAYKSREAYVIEPELTAHGTEEIKRLATLLQPFPDKGDFFLQTPQNSTAKNAYMKQAVALINKIKQGEAQKVVLSRILQSELPAGFDFNRFFELLMQSYPHAFVYLFYLPGEGLWTGATPEVLLNLQKEYAEIMALAGTRKKPPEGMPVRWDEKEKQEQAFVVRFVEEQIHKLFTQPPEKEETKTLFAGHLAHLCTRFRIPEKFLQGKTGALVSLLHPTPAVCGLPREKAWQMIAETEMHNRRFYTGFLGPWRLGNTSKLFVNLRCAEFSNQKITLYTGGGLTAASIPEKEWQETVDKSQTLLSVVEKIRNFAP